jgi:hypothetical protein
MATADQFVFLDDVQFQRNSWHCRNKILLSGQTVFLTVPVRRTGLDTPLSDAQIDYNQNWRKSHEGQIRQAYSRTPGGPLIIDVLCDAWINRPKRLLDLNFKIIKSLSNLLEIETPLLCSSSLDILGERSERIHKICKYLHADSYLSPAGSAEYLADDKFDELGGVTLHLQDFISRAYPQHQALEFFSHLSVVDLIANLGVKGASEYVRYPSFSDLTSEAE